MSEFNRFPYTDFHEMNLDWVISQIKKNTEEWEKVKPEIEKATTESVYKWLAEHPEATTTVQDGSITEEKIEPSFLEELLRPARPTKRRFILMADSYGDYDAGGHHYSWTEYCKSRLDAIYGAGSAINISTGSRGFVYNPAVGTFLTGLQNTAVENEDTITDIYVCGGTNDTAGMTLAGITEGEIVDAISAFVQYCRGRFVNAVIHIGYNGNYYNSRTNVEKVRACYKNCVNFGAVYMTNLDCVLDNVHYLDSSAIHPNATGFELLNYHTYQSIMTGMIDFERKAYTPAYTLADNVDSIIINPLKVEQHNNMYTFSFWVTGNAITFKNTKPLLGANFNIDVLTYGDYEFPYQSTEVALGEIPVVLEFDNNQKIFATMEVKVTNNRKLRFTYIPAKIVPNSSVNISTNRVNKISTMPYYSITRMMHE